ncbi:histidine phosphatase family protein [Mycobacterium sp.]|uniref:histidine phosphatase family protein n=1 Tax=Mycobacterium sp. TaxID=1785 RepID=UPI003C744C25
MQLLLVRHALPLRSEPGEGADPELSDVGLEQAMRLPKAFDRHSIARVLSSPQRRAQQTAQPVADALGLELQIDDRLAEYDRDLAHYVPIEQIREEFPDEWERLARGHLPSGVDEDAFVARVFAVIDDVVARADHDDTVALFSHGGVINVILHRILGTEKLLLFPIDYASVTRLRYSRRGEFTVAEVNGTEHVWDLLPRNAR